MYYDYSEEQVAKDKNFANFLVKEKELHKSNDDLEILVSANLMLEKVRDSIETHKWLLNKVYTKEISESQAMDSWLEYVFSPIHYMFKRFYRNKWKTYTPNGKVATILSVMVTWDELKKEVSKEKRPISISKAFWFYLYIMELKKVKQVYYFTRYLLSI